MKIVGVIAARMGSTRLPGKALMPILGKPMLEMMIDRVTRSKYLDDVIIATTIKPSDDELVSWAENYGIGYFRGSEEDVLGRISDAVLASEADVAVELLGDNPLVHADLIDDVIGFYKSNRYDYVVSATTEHKHTSLERAMFPIGIRVEVLSQVVLSRCGALAQEEYYRENALSYIYHNPDIFSIGFYEAKGKWSNLNRPELHFAINYQENFDLVEEIFNICHPENENFDLLRILEVCDEHPEFMDLMGVPASLR